MKRCPLCDFLYEDDQSLCDLDGIELIYDRVALMVPPKAAAIGPVLAAKSPRRMFLVMPLIGIVLGVALFSAYQVSTGRSAWANADPTSASAAGRPAPAPARVDALTPAASPTPSPAESPTTNDVEGADTAAPAAKRSPPARPRAARAGEKGRRPESGNSKKESKLKSIVNKTGRILKKPFNF